MHMVYLFNFSYLVGLTFGWSDDVAMVIVFIPMWIYDSILLLYLTLNLVIHCKRPTNRTFHAMRRKIWNLTCAILKLVAQIMLCLKLELENSTNHPDFKLPLYYVMIPIWIILPVALVDTFFTMYYQI